MNAWMQKKERKNIMCTPVGHSLAGAILVHQSRYPFSWSDWKSVLGLLFAANLPDVDFLFGWIQGNPNQYHQGATHSLFFIAAVSLALGWGYSRIHPGRGLAAGGMIFAALAVHLICDMLGNDTSPPVGIPLFWPVSGMAVHSPVSLFDGVNRSADAAGFIRSLFCPHNGRVVLREIGIMGVVFAGLTLFRKRR